MRLQGTSMLKIYEEASLSAIRQLDLEGAMRLAAKLSEQIRGAASVFSALLERVETGKAAIDLHQKRKESCNFAASVIESHKLPPQSLMLLKRPDCYLLQDIHRIYPNLGKSIIVCRYFSVGRDATIFYEDMET